VTDYSKLNVTPLCIINTVHSFTISSNLC